MTGQRYLAALVACMAVFMTSSAFARSDQFSFGVIGQPFGKTTEEAALRRALVETGDDNLAFVIVNGVKSRTEPCTDQLYQRRKSLLDESQHGLILSLSAHDWVNCTRSDGRPLAMERLNRVRELFFTEEFSFGKTRIPIVRQSLTPKFRMYGENMRWRIGNVLFGTVNLPSNNNNFVFAAGRNSEFEDRLVANRAWLEQLLTVATRKNLKGIVIFSDGNPFAKPAKSSLFSLRRDRDGFLEVRRHLTVLASRFKGRILVIHSQAKPEASPSDNIVWRKNLGTLGVSADWVKITADLSQSTLFSIAATHATRRLP